jgi:hypothetical protein
VKIIIDFVNNDVEDLILEFYDAGLTLKMEDDYLEIILIDIDTNEKFLKLKFNI